ncbi:MAG: YihY/virulence factor BrkB family protein [Bacteroidales bacterium]|nr:MAG: YihY/virulence factor BrkB family protein [Bacteroidales bacterium]HJC78790.1 YihY/virulence factor BrkB family protein [Candidatus Alistipes merdipullorum]
MRLSDIITFFTDTVFRKGAGEYRNPVARWAVRQYKLLFYTVQGLSSHGTMVRSAALTFYTLMSLVPVVALVFAVVKGFGLAEGLEQNLYEVLPQSPEVIDYVVGFAQKALARTQGGWVALVGVLTLFWAVIKVFGSIEDAFNNIWEVRSTRSAARKYGDYIAVVVVAPILWVISSSMGNYAAEILGVAGSPALEVLSRAGSLVVAWVMFTFIYVVLPSTKVRFTAALTAGVVAGTAFVLFQWGYVYLQRWMTSYNAIYGSFAALPLFLLWMQISWEILLLGGELSFAYQNVARFDEERESLLVSYDCRRKLMVGVMVLVSRAFRDGRGAVSFSEIRDRLDVPTRIMNNILYTLVQARMLNEIRTEGTDYDLEYAPARDISTLRVYDILSAVDSHGFGRDTIDMRSNRELRRCAEVVERLKDVTRASAENVLLIDIMDGAEQKSED